MDVFYHLDEAELHLRRAQDQLNDAPEKADIAALLEAVASIDLHYKEYCDAYDVEIGQSKGVAYEEGISLEYEIEADWWHDVSKAFRNLRQDK